MKTAKEDPTLLIAVAPFPPEFPAPKKISGAECINTLVYCPRRKKTAFVKDVLVSRPSFQVVENIIDRKAMPCGMFKSDPENYGPVSLCCIFKTSVSDFLFSLLRGIQGIAYLFFRFYRGWAGVRRGERGNSGEPECFAYMEKGNGAGGRLVNNDSIFFCSGWLNATLRFLASMKTKAKCVHSVDGSPDPKSSSLVRENDYQSQERAYWLQHTIRSAIYGRVRYGVVLKRRFHPPLPKRKEFLGGEGENDKADEKYNDGYDGAHIIDAEWEITSEYCAVKEMYWSRIKKFQGRQAENPLNEVAALQLLMEHHQRQHEAETTAAVVIPMDVLSNEESLYVISPHCNGGELFEMLQKAKRFSEREARLWMIQILLGMEQLHGLGICHRDLSFENILVHNRKSLVADLGMCLRVPFESDVYPTCDPEGEETDVSTADEEHYEERRNEWDKDRGGEGYKDQHFNSFHNSLATLQQTDHEPFQPILASCPSRLSSSSSSLGPTSLDKCSGESGQLAHRCGTAPHSSLHPPSSPSTFHTERGRRLLITPMGTCGKALYMAPEIYHNNVPFDGFAVDLWAAGVILFIMVTGVPPWQEPTDSDEGFRCMSGKMLMTQFLTKLELGLSPELIDLLQRMLAKRPSKRLTLKGVYDHPWIANDNHVLGRSSRANTAA